MKYNSIIFPSCVFPFQPLSATVPQTLPCSHTLKWITFSFDYYCYIHLNAYLQIHTHTYVQPTESIFVVYIFMASRLTTLSWTINKGAHTWETLILLLPPVSSDASSSLLSSGTPWNFPLPCQHVHRCHQCSAMIHVAHSKRDSFTTDFLGFRLLEISHYLFCDVPWQCHTNMSS